MGIIEFHLHEPDFDFSPSMTKGVESADDESTDDEAVDWDESGGSGGPGVGALVALVVLVAIAALVGLKRRGGSDDEYDENVDVAD